MVLCQYKDALGEPGKGVHTHFMGYRYYNWRYFVIYFIYTIEDLKPHLYFFSK